MTDLSQCALKVKGFIPYLGGLMQDLFEWLIREKNYLEGVAPKTLVYYKTCWSAFNRYKGEVSESGLKTWVINRGKRASRLVR